MKYIALRLIGEPYPDLRPYFSEQMPQNGQPHDGGGDDFWKRDVAFLI